jgi:hypothetical protein
MRNDITKSESELAAWDAEIEAEYQSLIAGTKARAKAHKQRKHAVRFVGAPFAFWTAVCQATKGQAALVVAMLIYRRTCVDGKPTVTLPSDELTALGVNRRQKSKALLQLAAAGLVRIEPTAPGRATKVTLLAKAGQPGPGGPTTGC